MADNGEKIKTLTPRSDQTKSFVELEKETRESAKKSLDEYFGFMNDLDRDDWFSVYINSITSGYDPHTNYFAPEEKNVLMLALVVN
jgi:carboxyl-terminal processing protease